MCVCVYWLIVCMYVYTYIYILILLYYSSYGPPHMAEQKQDDQLEITYRNYVRTQDVTLKTCRRRWMIGRSGERGSGISVLVARHDDDDDDDDIIAKSLILSSLHIILHLVRHIPTKRFSDNQQSYYIMIYIYIYIYIYMCVCINIDW